MDERIFIGHKAGEVRWADNGQYCYFMPHDLPFDYEPDRGTLLAEQSALIGLSRLDGLTSRLTPDDLHILVIPFSLNESVSSSSIEGTRSTLDDVLRSEKIMERDESRARDNREVLNYMAALEQGYDAIDSGSALDAHLLMELHRTLMSGTRGSDRSPGVFKVEQNAIGRPGDTLETAKMVPAPPVAVDHLLDNWTGYISDRNQMVIERLALAHYQFEAIHPFRDGNGRMGRLALMLMLRMEGVLRQPVLYPSRYFDRHRQEYIDRLFDVSSRDDIDGWIRFFSRALSEQADESADLIGRLLGYRDQLLSQMDTATSMRAVPLLFRNPYINSRDIVEGLGVSAPTAIRILKEFEEKGIVRPVDDKVRGRTYLADSVMEILSGRRCARG